MKNWEAERLKEIHFSGIRRVFEKVSRLEQAGEKVINLSIGRPDFDTPVHIKNATKKALDSGMVHYASNYGLLELREAIAEKLKRENDISYDPGDEIIVTVGANEAIFLAMFACLNPGDEIILPEPAWSHYFHCARMAGAKPISIPLREENEFKIDTDELARAITPKTKMIVINSPHNPTGSVLEKEKLEKIAELAEKHDLLVLSDEIYEKIIYDGTKALSFASLPNMKERTLTINGFSKAYAMDGWRLGYVAAPKHLVHSLIRVHQYTAVCVATFAQVGAAVAYRESQNCVRDMVEEFGKRRKYLLSALEGIEGFTCVNPQGAFYAFPSIKALEMSSIKMTDFLLDEAKVALIPGSEFGQQGEGYLRFAYSNSLDNIKEAIERIKLALKKL